MQPISSYYTPAFMIITTVNLFISGSNSKNILVIQAFLYYLNYGIHYAQLHIIQHDSVFVHYLQFIALR